MATVLWDVEGVILEDICPLVKPLTQICTVKLLKNLAEAFQGSSPSKNVAEIVIHCDNA